MGHRRKRRAGLLVCAGLILSVGSYWWLGNHRRPPAPVHQKLFPGVLYDRLVLRSPEPVVIHVLTVQLDTPGLSFLVTPGDPSQPRPLHARTTSQFVREFGLQAAINGDFFYPWHSSNLWDYYPHVGDAVDVQGFASSQGRRYCNDVRKQRFPTLYLSARNEASFNKPRGRVYNAISGDWLFVQHGKFRPSASVYHLERQPRTAVALDRAARRLFLVVVDGRQPGYSAGLSLEALAHVVVACGGETALNLDGGGSSELVCKDLRSRRPVVLSCPIDNRIPGRERPVANHLGIYVPEERGGTDSGATRNPPVRSRRAVTGG